jgi:hypothetical protein
VKPAAVYSVTTVLVSEQIVQDEATRGTIILRRRAMDTPAGT